MRKMATLIPRPGPRRPGLAARGRGPGADTRVGLRLQAGRRQQAGDLRPVDRLPEEARGIEPVHQARRGRQDDQGRTMYFALISSPTNLANLDRYREIAQRLAHPQGLTDGEARALAREGRAFVHLDGGCHATEVAGAQMMPQLAYDLLGRADDPAIARSSPTTWSCCGRR